MSAKQLKGTNVFSKIVPGTENDTYPTHDSLYGHGGYKEVATIAERDAIPIERLKDGTVVYVSENTTEYRYEDGKWVLKKQGVSLLGELEDVDTGGIVQEDILLMKPKGTESWVPMDVEQLKGKDGVIAYPTMRIDVNTGHLILGVPTDNYENRFKVENGHLMLIQNGK